MNRSGSQLGKQLCERWEIIGEQIFDTGETADIYNLWHDPVRRFLLPADGRPLGVNDDNFVLAIQIGTLWIALPPVYPLSYVNVGVAMEVNQGMLALQMNALLVPRADNDFANEINLEDCP